MLLLSRKVGERVVVADEIVIQILEMHGDQVRLGIEAPREVTILREELATRCKPASFSPGRVSTPQRSVAGVEPLSTPEARFSTRRASWVRNHVATRASLWW